jgi:hypothetical protein
MNALDFIRDDLERQKHGRLNGWLYALIVPLAAAGLGLVLRRDAAGLRDVSFVVSAGLATLLAGGAVRAALGSRSREFVLGIVLLQLLVCTRLVSTLPPAGYGGLPQFGHETLACWGKGVMGGAILSALIVHVVLHRMAMTPRSSWFGLATLPAASVATLLAWHCLSTHPGHLALGHLVPGVLCGTLTWVSLRIGLMRRIARALPPNLPRSAVAAVLEDNVTGK